MDSSSPPLTFKIASEEWEFDEVSRLNYQTFVEEIPQHDENRSRTLVDRFHEENTYIICLRGDRLVGMVAARDRRPFSLDQKLDDLDAYLPQGSSVCEIRLLSIDPLHRNGRIIQGLLTMLAQHCMTRGYDIVIISGAVQQQKLYRRLGFVPFGPQVGTPDAMYQPMYRELATLQEDFGTRVRAGRLDAQAEAPVNLLPGPVGIRRDVREAFAEVALSHRSPAFVEGFGDTKRLLCGLVGSPRVEILMGSGTMANDVIAGQLSLKSERGLVLSNGEFGDRLDHARRMRLSFDTLRVGWGEVIDRVGIEHAVQRSPEIAWLWAVHCETSTGVLNDLPMLKEVCSARGIKLVLDCISSIGTVDLDLGGTHLASGVSGKGLGAFAGLSMVFYDHQVEPAPQALPRYLDLGLHASKNGVPFTMSSNLVFALRAALKRFGAARVFEEIADVTSWLSRGLRGLGFQVVAPDGHASPAVITIALPEELNSGDVGERLEEAGYLLSYNSDYLLKRNWIQACLMGELSRETVSPLLELLPKFAPVRR
jgi:aspartate aminotransferase-like enzyme